MRQPLSTEKEEPIEGRLQANEGSVHYKLVGKYLTPSYSNSSGWDLERLLQDNCVIYYYDSEMGEEIESVYEEYRPPEAIQLELSTYRTYL